MWRNKEKQYAQDEQGGIRRGKAVKVTGYFKCRKELAMDRIQAEIMKYRKAVTTFMQIICHQA